MYCNYCELRCRLDEGMQGVCRMYQNCGGVIKEIYPYSWTSFYVNHIEAVPFYHAYPGSRCLVIGSMGCNFDCQYCSNSYIAKAHPAEVSTYELLPKQIIAKTRQTGCHSIVFGVNEPTVSWPSLLELAAEAHKCGILMGCLTNGYMTPEIAREMGLRFDFVNVSLKGMSDEFYRQYVHVPSVVPVLRNLEILAGLTHTEVTTPVIQTVNDEDIPAMAEYLAGIDPQIPWHVFRLLPEYNMKSFSYPDINQVNELVQEARSKLDYIYFGNFVGSDWVSTFCPACGEKVIERVSAGGCGAKIINYNLMQNKCPVCGQEIKLYGKRTDWDGGEKDWRKQ